MANREELKMNDPTYDVEKIKLRGDWNIAFTLSEMVNDNAPLGWSKYIPLAEKVIEQARKVS